MPGIFLPVRCTDLVMDGVVGVYLNKDGISVDSACLDMSFMPDLSGAEPFPAAPIHRANIETITDTNNPIVVSFPSVPSSWSDAIFSSSAVPIFMSSSPVHAVIVGSLFTDSVPNKPDFIRAFLNAFQPEAALF